MKKQNNILDGLGGKTVIKLEDKEKKSTYLTDKKKPMPGEPSVSKTTRFNQRLSKIKLGGFLDDVSDYYEQTARKNQPLFKNQTALGIASVILGRRFATEGHNYASLYLLNIAKSGCGKEHIKTVTEKVLDSVGMSNLIAGDGYTSAGAVFSVLRNKPCHISVIDELGHYLNAANLPNNSVAKSANIQLMECIARLDGVVRSKNYSSMSSTQPFEPVTIYNPAITVQSMTTPDTFYSALSVDMIKDGFLGRFLPVMSDEPRQMTNHITLIQAPESMKRWVNAIAGRCDDPMNLAGNSEMTVNPVVISWDAAAKMEHKQFDFKINRLAEELDKQGISELVVRYAEFAMRLSLIITLSRDPSAKSITLQDAELACDYMFLIAHATVENVLKNMSGSEYERDRNEVLEKIRLAGSKGMSVRKIKRLMPLRKMKSRDADEILNHLVELGYIESERINEGRVGKPSYLIKHMDYA